MESQVVLFKTIIKHVLNQIGAAICPLCIQQVIAVAVSQGGNMQQFQFSLNITSLLQL